MKRNGIQDRRTLSPHLWIPLRSMRPLIAPYEPHDEDARDRAMAEDLASRLSAARFRRKARLVARALARRVGADTDIVIAEWRGRGDRLRDRRSAHVLSRSDCGCAGALGVRRRRGPHRRGQNNSRRRASISTSIPTTPAASASTDKRGFSIAGAGVNPISGKAGSPHVLAAVIDACLIEGVGRRPLSAQKLDAAIVKIVACCQYLDLFSLMRCETIWLLVATFIAVVSHFL